MGKIYFMLIIFLIVSVSGLWNGETKRLHGADYEITSEPRPTITPIPRATLEGETSNTEDYANTQNNAHIILRGEKDSITSTMLTIVQWQDTESNWHNIDGWTGNFDNQQQVRWWVAPEHFQTGPYRWVVLAGKDDANNILWLSEPFYLPDRGQALVIPVTVSSLVN